MCPKLAAYRIPALKELVNRHSKNGLYTFNSIRNPKGGALCTWPCIEVSWNARPLQVVPSHWVWSGGGDNQSCPMWGIKPLLESLSSILEISLEKINHPKRLMKIVQLRSVCVCLATEFQSVIFHSLARWFTVLYNGCGWFAVFRSSLRWFTVLCNRVICFCCLATCRRFEVFSRGPYLKWKSSSSAACFSSEEVDPVYEAQPFKNAILWNLVPSVLHSMHKHKDPYLTSAWNWSFLLSGGFTGACCHGVVVLVLV